MACLHLGAGGAEPYDGGEPYGGGGNQYQYMPQYQVPARLSCRRMLVLAARPPMCPPASLAWHLSWLPGGDLLMLLIIICRHRGAL